MADETTATTPTPISDELRDEVAARDRREISGALKPAP
jgi:hypothetical protein